MTFYCSGGASCSHSDAVRTYYLQGQRCPMSTADPIVLGTDACEGWLRLCWISNRVYESKTTPTPTEKGETNGVCKIVPDNTQLTICSPLCAESRSQAASSATSAVSVHVLSNNTEM